MDETQYAHGSINNFKDVGKAIKEFIVDTTERPIARCKVTFRKCKCGSKKESNGNCMISFFPVKLNDFIKFILVDLLEHLDKNFRKEIPIDIANKQPEREKKIIKYLEALIERKGDEETDLVFVQGLLDHVNYLDDNNENALFNVRF
jgi:hypothetical protein